MLFGEYLQFYVNNSYLLTFGPEDNNWNLKDQNYLLKLFFFHPQKKNFSLTNALKWFPDFRQILPKCKLRLSLSSIVLASI